MIWEGTPVEDATRASSAAIAAWNTLVVAVRAEAPANRLDRARAAVSGVLDPSGSSSSGPDLTFGEQITADVSAVTEAQRTAALEDLGPSALGFVQAVWVCDLGKRAGRALEVLFGSNFLEDPMSEGHGGVGGPSGGGQSAWAAQEHFTLEVAKLGAIDPVTSELVRLRGARAHACRLCQSLRNRTAVETAGRAELFDGAADREEALSERHQAALALVDAMIWQPMSWPHGLAGRVRESFAPAEAVELILDVVRNASNKIAVALAADAPHVTDGIEYYDIDPASGQLTYGLPPVGAGPGFMTRPR